MAEHSKVKFFISVEYFYMDPRALHPEQLDYELQLRKESVDGCKSEKAARMRQILAEEANGRRTLEYLKYSPMEPAHDLMRCSYRCEELIKQTGGPNLDYLSLMAYWTRVVHLEARLERIRANNVVEEEQHRIVLFAARNIKSMIDRQLHAQVNVSYERVFSDNWRGTTDFAHDDFTLSQSIWRLGPIHNTQIPNQVPIYGSAANMNVRSDWKSSSMMLPEPTDEQRLAEHTERKPFCANETDNGCTWLWEPIQPLVALISHWNISFSGDAESSSRTDLNLSDFLYQINVFRRAEGLDQDDLLSQLCHLLSGSALLWYRRVHRNIRTWTEFETAIKVEFSDSKRTFLIDDVKNCRQSNTESVSSYINNMESKFHEMPTKISEERKLYIVQNNLLPCFAMFAAAHNPRTICELKAVCMRLEGALAMTHRLKSNTPH